VSLLHTQLCSLAIRGSIVKPKPTGLIMGKPTQALKGMNITHNTLQNALRARAFFKVITYDSLLIFLLKK
jgi:hypothetical protein